MRRTSRPARAGKPRFPLSWRPSPIDLAIAAAVALIWGWQALYRLFGDGLHLIGFLNAGGHVWGLLALLLALAAAVRRAWLTAAAALLAAVATLSTVYWPLPRSGESAQKLRVVTASLRSLNPHMAEAAQALDALQPDLLIVQEASDPDAFLAAFLRARPGWHVARHQSFITVARWPVTATDATNTYLRAKVDIPGQTFTVWNMHAPKNYRSVIENRQFFHDLAQAIRTDQPAIAAGDFNASPWNEGYATIDALLDDGYRRTRWMPGFTFPGPARNSGRLGPFTTIDHIFASPGLKPLHGFTAPASRGADHLPVAVDYALPTPPAGR